MTEELHDLLYLEAIDLAYEMFANPVDAHVEAVFERLLANYRLGLDSEGVTTVH